MTYRNKKLTRSAEDAPCMMHGPTCNGGQGDVCWRHSNYLRHGKGRSIKAHDIFGFYGCQPCEDWFSITSSRAEREEAWFPAWERSLIWAADKGVL